MMHQRPSSASQWTSLRRKGRYVGIAGVLFIASACGTNFEQLLFESGSAIGRTYLDVLLTDFANALATSSDPEPTPPDDGDNGDTEPDDPGNDPATLTGDSAVGEMLYGSNGCASCHCPDATGGCALDAPTIVGVPAGDLNIHLRGPAPHPTKFNLSDQDLADLAAFLATLP